jgi:hypothetical protein
MVFPYLRRLTTGFPLPQPGFDPRSNHMGTVVDKAALRRVYSENSISSAYCRSINRWTVINHPISTLCGVDIESSAKEHKRI